MSLSNLVNTMFICLILSGIIIIFNGINNANHVEKLDCKQYIIEYNPDINTRSIYDRHPDFDMVPSQCKNQFIKFYESKNGGDLSLRWSQFKEEIKNVN